MADPKRLEDKDRFIKEALLLHQALTLCRSMIKPNDRFESALFEAVRTMLLRLAETSGKSSWKEINFQINELLKQSVQSEGVINLFADVEFSIFDEKFLEEIGRMKEKNLAVEILKKLLLEKVRLYKRTNLVKSEKFSELLARIMNAYINGQLTNEEVIEELLKMAQEMAAYSAEESGLGLSDEEMAFYDALTKPSAVKDFYENEELVAITRELTEQLRANRTIDWQKKESARAAMRLMVKKLLKRHKYPHAVNQMQRNIKLIRYKKFDDNFLLFEHLNAPIVKPIVTIEDTAGDKKKTIDKTFRYQYEHVPEKMRLLFDDIRDYIMSGKDDVTENELKLYLAFRKVKNFICGELYNTKILLNLNINPDEVQLKDDFIKDIRNIGHWGTGQLQIVVKSKEDFEATKFLIDRAYEEN